MNIPVTEWAFDKLYKQLVSDGFEPSNAHRIATNLVDGCIVNTQANSNAHHSANILVIADALRDVAKALIV